MKEFNPGPGQYDGEREHQKSIPSIKFGTGSRSSLDSPLKRYIPGPG